MLFAHLPQIAHFISLKLTISLNLTIRMTGEQASAVYRGLNAKQN
jgi:hypothetical protein